MNFRMDGPIRVQIAGRVAGLPKRDFLPHEGDIGEKRLFPN